MSDLTHHQLKLLQGALHALEINTRTHIYPHETDHIEENNTHPGASQDATPKESVNLNPDNDSHWVHHYVAKLKAIETAKIRMSRGNYGKCLKCNKPIDYKRLIAYPTAQRCLKCQYDHAKKQS